ncbi:thermonuclease family protein [bacterium]|nr:thermonuclease family protein [bacterium]
MNSKLKTVSIILFILVLSAAILLLISQDKNLRVKYTIDGDTIVLNDGRHVRLIGIDTPEMNYRSPTPPEPFAREATRFTDSLATGRLCYLVYNSTGDKVDRYGRTLAFVYLLPDSMLLNGEIIKNGYSPVFDRYRFDPEFLALFRKFEKQAQYRKLGMWHNNTN